ncbi:MAG: hypothetical protein ASUL_01230 [Candidatus Aramenus sulfurataquae]|jgi:hypothetical protein|uniref:ArsR family transcriptional regulator n=2 Tax=Candidatus Aramenus sulfurataquae TaxID=1326980 RepID=W7L8Y2_9CREN|nr:MAG: hypothetical protein ASUL_01230 [Candidatus Aramenus sulfurataquae]MBW9141430.1 hypothetical protein [Candidatus Aramenus sp.]MCL7344343.1 hypothetical protein [Candidatus Aramenus sulfurataquae]
MKYGELSVSKLAKLSGVRFSILKEELEYLKGKEYIEVIEVGRVKVVKLNYSNHKVIILRNLLEEIEEI